MKKNKKHLFVHKDPESIKETGARPEKESRKINTEVPNYVRSDLKKVLFSITVFTLFIIGLYILQTKTELLKPALSIFGL